MEEVWFHAPHPALRVRRQGQPACQPNAAARDWAQRQGLGEEVWAGLLEPVLTHARLGGDCVLPLAPGLAPVALRCVALSDGAVAWLVGSEGSGGDKAGAADDLAPAARPSLEADGLGLLHQAGQVGFFSRDLATGEGRWDQAMFELVGLAPADGPPDWQRFLSDCVHPDDRSELERHYRSATDRGGRGDVYFRIRRPDGEVRLVHSLYEVRPGGDGQPAMFVGVMLDAGARGRPADDGPTSRRYLIRATEMAGITVWRVDRAAQRIRFNSVGYEMLGLVPGPDGVPLADVRALMHPVDRPVVVASEAEAYRTGKVIEVEARYLRPEGGWRDVITRRVAEYDGHGEATGLLGVSIDVSETRAERERNRDLLEQTRLATETLGVAFWSLGTVQDGLVWDEQMYRLYRRDRARPAPGVDEFVDEYVHPTEREAVRQRLHADIAQGVPSTTITARMQQSGGPDRWIRATTVRRVDPDGRRISVGMHVDVTEQHLAELAQREAERTERASREKSAFMTLMSHRLRTPLNAVLGFSQLLSQDAAEPLSARQRDRLARIDTAGHDLLAMVDDVFELASLDDASMAVTRVPVALDAVLDQVLDAVGPMAGQRGVTLGIQGGGQGLVVETDRRLLAQALRHLTSHAVRRNDAGGWVSLVVESGDVPAGAARLRVRDGGAPLTAQQRHLLFDPLTAAADAPQAGASGETLIGLDLVRLALERLGAQIQDQPGDGPASDLVVRLPLAPAGSALAGADDAGGAAAMPGDAAPGLRLLCIEDNAVNLMLVEELVAMRPSTQLLKAHDGLSGLALAAAQRPDAVLLDLHLPDIPGTEVLRRLRADPATAGCTVIALSANAMPEDIRDALAQGFDDYWTKPIDFDQFLAGLDRLTASRAG